jgi:tRNA dimethylallyltransferase
VSSALERPRGAAQENPLFEAILIAGPTASGKSALAIALAERLGGVVINADSMQVYRDLRIITARPTPEEEAQAPHLMFGHVDAAVNYSAGYWIADVQRALEQAREMGRIPILAGGTGLYFKAMLHGLSDIPKVPEDVRTRVRASAEALATPDLHAQLQACDPATAARLKANDRQRILRALEVQAATGQSITAFQSQRGAPLIEVARCRCLFLAPVRAELYARIDRRFDGMIAAGALDEVKALATRVLDPALPAMRAHGVPGFLTYLRGEMTLDEAIAKGKLDTRHYAKRQFTWFRHQLPDFEWVAPEAGLDAVLAGC